MKARTAAGGRERKRHRERERQKEVDRQRERETERGRGCDLMPFDSLVFGIESTEALLY